MAKNENKSEKFMQYENPVETLFNPQPVGSYLPYQIQNRANSTLLDNIAESNNAFENNFQYYESTNQEVRETEFNLEHFLSEIIDDMLSKMFF
jgi:replication initiation and membrane attachment protein DnaB